jgi:hypothetical protein
MDIFRQGVDERTAEALITGPEDKLSLHLSPDGQWLMYFAFPGGYSVTKAPLLMRGSALRRPSATGIQSAPCLRFSLPESPRNYVRLERMGEQATCVLCA